MSGFPSRAPAPPEVALGQAVPLALTPTPGERYLPVGSRALRAKYPALSALFPPRLQRGAREITLWNKHHPDGATNGNGVIVFPHRFDATCLSTQDGGATWALSSLPNGSQWNGVAYGNGVFVACSNTGQGAVSANGLSWSGTTLPSGQQWFRLRFGNGRFLMFTNSTNLVATSTDGSTWTQAAVLPSSGQWYGVAYGNGIWAAMRADNQDVAYSTDDGATWTSTTRPASGPIYHIDYAAGLFVAVAYSGSTYLTSPDGVTWTARTFPNSAARRLGIGNGAGFFCWIEDTTAGFTSLDGITWQEIALPSTDLTADRECALYSGGCFYMPGMGTASMRVVDPGWVSDPMILGGPAGYHVRVR